MSSLTITRSSVTTVRTPFGDIEEQPRKPPSVKARTIAAASGAAMTALTMTPFDVIKTRLQTQGQAAGPSTSRLLFPNAHVCPACAHPLPLNALPAASPIPSSCNLSPRAARNLSYLALASPGTLGRHTTACAWDVRWANDQQVIGPGRPSALGGFWDGVAKVWRTEGVRGLWKGAGTTLTMSVPAQTLYMLTYSHLLITLPANSVTPLLSGVLSRTLITTLISPLELIRTRLQATPLPSGPPITLRSTLSQLALSIRQSGLTTLWRGLPPSLWRDVPFSGIYWLLQHNITLALTPSLPVQMLGAPLAFFSGFTAGSLASLVTNPFDVLKTRRQCASLPSKIGTVRAIAKIAREEGVRALWVGVGPRTAKIAPACGIMIACYEGVARIIP